LISIILQYLVFAYCILVIIDCVRVSFFYQEIFHTKNYRDIGSFYSLTFLGKRLKRLLADYCNRVFVYEARLKYEDKAKLANELKTVLDSIDLLLNRADITEGNLYWELIKIISKPFSCLSAALIVSYDSGGFADYCYRNNNKNFSQKFRDSLRYKFVSFFEYGDRTCIGLKDSHSGNLFVDALSIHGYRFSLTQEILLDSAMDSKSRAIFWLGYGDLFEPSQYEVTLSEQIAKGISTKLFAQRKIDELSTEVKNVKVLEKHRQNLLTHASHDIRAPLNNIKSILSLLQIEGVAVEHKELVDVALNNSHQMAEIVEGILDLSRFQAGNIETRKEIFSVYECTQEIANSYLVSARLKSLELILSEIEAEILVELDKRHYKRVLSNIFSNAIKYTKEGHIKVDIFDEGSDFVDIVVTDTGIGMNDDAISRLFIPFARFHKEEAEGVGLGLTLSKLLIEANGGRISVNSILKKGSTFKLSIPKKNSSSLNTINVNQSSFNIEFNQVVENTDILDCRVLIVDDDPNCVESLARNVDRLGCSVTRAFSVQEALSIINFEPPDFLISDYNMPEGGVIKILKFISDNKFCIKTLVLTGANESSVANTLSNLGCDEIMSKSVLFEKIKSWIQKNLYRNKEKKEEKEVADTVRRLVA
jgi:signal transduction histidine kinase/ActR/RegA family two-component response regulator